MSEIEVLVDYLTKLLETQGKKGLPKLSAKDIGIIAPYRKQVSLHAAHSNVYRCGQTVFGHNAYFFLTGGENPKGPEVRPGSETMD